MGTINYIHRRTSNWFLRPRRLIWYQIFKIRQYYSGKNKTDKTLALKKGLKSRFRLRKTMEVRWISHIRVVFHRICEIFKERPPPICTFEII